MIMARKTGRFLMCRRSVNAPYPQTWATWGGKTEDREMPEDTAKREVFEETGIRIDNPLEHLYHFELPTFSFHTFLAIVEEEISPQLNDEAEDFAWMALEDVGNNIHEGLSAILQDRATVKRLIKFVEGTSGRPCDFDRIYRKP